MVVELRHLRYFVTVAAERSFSRASEKLHIAQPPLSRQIQQLEEELGTQLLHRGRPITLTESGRYFFEQALQVLQRTDEIRAMARRIGAGKKRQVASLRHWCPNVSRTNSIGWKTPAPEFVVANPETGLKAGFSRKV
jgi:DNA-binding transcriptional LysR family regulator